ncbi:MAG TPA: zinc-ribbon domain-containing protein [Methanomassiliicoccales archaeon]|nr:zinc-ribbon domain-containing protein [Methanomassiliicoccales archaeon]
MIDIFCPKCGAEQQEGAAFCFKCGAKLTTKAQPATEAKENKVLAPMEAKSLNCPSCGAPITPKLREMVITCEYCGTGISLGDGIGLESA